MNFDVSFLRKVAYVFAIALLWFPLFMLGQPAVQNPARPSAGGVLARMRSAYGLSQAQLGEIDPASETMKMATLGLRGVATSVLWHKANEYKKTEDWDNLAATLEQIAKLQPNYVSVWEFQAHNLSYNVSSEFDNYRHRYHWVKKGIEYLLEGTRYNRNNPKAHSRLLWNVGWFCGHKIGIADEVKQYRRLFRADEDFHSVLNRYVDIDSPRGIIRSGRGLDGKPDNWRVSYLWLDYAQDEDRTPVTWLREDISVEGATERRRSALIFFSDAPMALISFCKANQDEGYFDEKIQRAWREAETAWNSFGDRLVPAAPGYDIRLNDYEKEKAEVDRLRKRLNALAPNARERIRQEKIERLSNEERRAFETPAESQTPKQQYLHYIAKQKIRVLDDDVAMLAAKDHPEEAHRVLSRIQYHDKMAERVGNYRFLINYDYWCTRCKAEQTNTAINARKHLYDAKRRFDDTDLVKAKQNYELAWKEWAELYRDYPKLVDDVTLDESVGLLKPYRDLLAQLGEPFPKDFPLNWLVDAQKALLSQYQRTGPSQESESAQGETSGKAGKK